MSYLIMPIQRIPRYQLLPPRLRGYARFAEQRLRWLRWANLGIHLWNKDVDTNIYEIIKLQNKMRISKNDKKCERELAKLKSQIVDVVRSALE